MKRFLKRLRGDRRGSGVITVLIAMLFIAALGSALLFTSYTGYQVKVSGRRSTENFYDADAAMSEVRAGVQKAVTESLASAYTSVLENYSSITGAYEAGKTADNTAIDKTVYTSLDLYLEARFQDYFKTALLGWKSGTTEDTALIRSGVCSADVLSSFIHAPVGCTVTLTAGGYSADDAAFTLRNISLSFTDEKGYKTNIQTDIAVKLPPFVYTPPGYSYTGINLYSVIVGGTLSATGSNDTLSGDAYAGNIRLASSGAHLTYGGGTLTCGGDIYAGNGATLTIGSAASGVTLWTRSLTVGAGGTLTTYGSANVANDLTLQGEPASGVRGASAVLNGSYFGFGYSSTAAASSSSILVNGRSCSLDLSGLNTLILAGSSFIQASGNYVMGESVAARSDQLVYLAPKSCLPEGVSSNPCLVTVTKDTAGNDVVTPSVSDTAAVLAKIRALGGYYAKVSGVKVEYGHLPSTGSTYKAAYFFMTFASQADANDFFKGYFAASKSDMSTYLATYLSYYKSASGVSSAGNTYSGTSISGSVSALGLASSSANLGSLAANYTGYFANRCVTLSDLNASYGGAANPYAYFVRTADVNALPANTVNYFPSADAPEAVIVNGSYTYAGGTEKIILASGNVTIPASGFSGLVIAGGNVTLQGSLSYSASAVSAALNVLCGDASNALCYGKSVMAFLRDGSNTAGSTGGGTGGSWDVDALVSYANWKKF